MTQSESSAPKPRPIPGPAGSVEQRPVTSIAPSEAKLKVALAFGRIDESGNVWVKDGDSERTVGQYPDGVPDDALEFYARRYLDLVAQVDLFAARLPQLNTKEIDSGLASLKEQVQEPAAVGDLQALRNRVEALADEGAERKTVLAKERVKAREAALANREAVVASAEQIAGQDPVRTQWKQSGQKLSALLGEWKQLQQRGPRLDRSVEDALWKRFSAARNQFDKNRRAFFTQLDASQAEARRIKEKLIAEAEKLSTSTDWAATAAALRNLMNEWKQTGRASRKEDDALWQRFHNAQQKFFDARNAQSAAIDQEQQENLKLKEALVEKAEALLPVEDIEQFKNALRPLQEEWDQIGRVPRQDMNRIENRMRAVEDALREAEDEAWQKSNPETKARAAGLAGQLQELIAELEAKIEKEKAAGNEKTVAQLEEDLAARKSWLAQVESF